MCLKARVYGMGATMELATHIWYTVLRDHIRLHVCECSAVID